MESETLEGLRIFTPEKHTDDRGWFMETYRKENYGLPEFVQDNLVQSRKHVLRGLHMQLPPWEQGKLIYVLEGEVLDVAVDCRTGSETFGQYEAVRLSSENRKQFWIPPGFAHGYVVLSDSALVAYKCTSSYRPEHERGILWDDPALGIDWMVASPIVSDRDAKNPKLAELREELESVSWE